MPQFKGPWPLQFQTRARTISIFFALIENKRVCVWKKKQSFFVSRLRHALTTYGEKFTPKEVNEAFDNMYIDDKGMIDTPSLIAMLTGKGDEDDD